MPDAAMNLITAEPDLTLCDLEPITRLERIQSFGFLLAMSDAWVIVRASANLQTFLGTEARNAIGMQLESLVDTEALHDIRNRMIGLSAAGSTERLYRIELIGGRPHLDLAIHYSGNFFILEGELAGADSRVDAASMVRKMLTRLSSRTTLDAFHGDASRQLRAMTQFDRVMIYQFTSTGSGRVIAETVVAGTESFLGLQYPASDIPVQARALYLRNPFRIIADVHAPAIPLLASDADRDPALDLSLAMTRAVAPVHLEYLRNMDVAASLSISIIIDGSLWGLIMCHSGTARLPDFMVRSAAELFGQMYSMTLENRLRQSEDRDERHARLATQDVLASIKGDPARLTNAGWLRDALQLLIPCDGVVAAFDGRESSSGLTPSATCVAEIADMAAILPRGPVFASDHLASLGGASAAHRGEAAGVLCISLSPTTANHLMFFRREWVHEVRWAGEPKDAPKADGDLARLSPRKSFAAFKESVQDRSRAFSPAELRVAELLRAEFERFAGTRIGPPRHRAASCKRASGAVDRGIESSGQERPGFDSRSHQSNQRRRGRRRELRQIPQRTRSVLGTRARSGHPAKLGSQPDGCHLRGRNRRLCPPTSRPLRHRRRRYLTRTAGVLDRCPRHPRARDQLVEIWIVVGQRPRRGHAGTAGRARSHFYVARA